MPAARLMRGLGEPVDQPERLIAFVEAEPEGKPAARKRFLAPLGEQRGLAEAGWRDDRDQLAGKAR